jgi:alkylmercury lyase
MVDGRRISAWCAWDTLFLPELLGKRTEVESKSPGSGQAVKLILGPAGVEYVEPADVHMSFVLPDQTQMRKDVLSTFCHFGHFFPSRQAGEAWTANHQGTFILAVPEAHAIAHRKNRALYGEAL